MKFNLVAFVLAFAAIVFATNKSFGQVVSADRFRSNDTGANGQVWERTEDAQNTIRYLYGPLGANGVVDLNDTNTRFRVTGRGSAIWTGRPDLGVDPALVTGAGNRMMWYPFKGAFRVGGVDGVAWDDFPFGTFTNIGRYSFASGFNTTARGDFSTAVGGYSFATGNGSLALGNAVGASAEGSMSIGSVAIGPTFIALQNSIPYSLMVGFRSDRPTLFVGPAPGLNATGSVGIATTDTQGYKLFVNGSVAAASYAQVSDVRFKANIRGIDNPLQRILRLNGIRYEWKKGSDAATFPGGTHIGFAAQEVEKVIPEVVSTGSDGYKAVEYQNVTAVLVEAVKEQQKIIDQQKERIARQEMELRQLQERQAVASRQVEEIKLALQKLAESKQKK